REYYLKRLVDGTDYNRAQVIERDPEHDLAIIRVEKVPPEVDALGLAATSPEVGQVVHGIGCPGRSATLWNYVNGTVRAVYMRKRTAVLTEGAAPTEMGCMIVETTSPTNYGDSGGPLVNNSGEMSAVTEAGTSRTSTFIDVTEVSSFVER